MHPQRILVLHNRYRESGGEDQAFAQETALLRERGHTLFEYTDSNQRLDESRPLAAGLEAIWSRNTVEKLEALLADTRPQVAHFHNTFALISPAAYYACRRAGVPVIQTLHNFRLGCVNACCTREGKPCQTCIAKPFAWPGVWRACYRESRIASAAVAGINMVHKTLGTYRQQVDAYISTSAFAREIHVRSGVPAERSFVKPNFSPDTPTPAEPHPPEDFALYAGRIVREKGVHLLLDAWRRLRPSMRLLIAGDGPDLAHLRTSANIPNVEFLGFVPRARVQELMARARVFVQPSLLLENCALTVIEALGAGVPLVVSGHGSFAELVEDGRSGLHFHPGDAEDLAAKLGWMFSHREEAVRMGRAARERFEENYSPDQNYRQLLAIYEAARRRRDAQDS